MSDENKAGEAPATETAATDPKEIVIHGGQQHEMRDLPIELLTLDRGLQARVKMDEDHIEHLQGVIRAKQERKGDPVVVFHYQVEVPDPNQKKKEGEEARLITQDHYLVADGFHWIEGHKREGKKRVRVQVREGTRTDALRYALGANAFHGRNRTTADKERAISLTLDNQRGLKATSNKAIARLTATSESLVARVRGEWEVLHAEEANAPRTGADGRKRGATRKPKATEVEKKRQQAVQGAAESLAMARKPDQLKVPQPGKVRSKGLTDIIGREVPETLAHVFQANVQIDGLIAVLKNAVGMVEQLRGVGALPFAPESIESNLKAALADLDAAKPTLVCPECDGDGCKLCSVRGKAWGFFPKAVWMAKPVEEKQAAIDALAETDEDAADAAEEAVEAATVGA